MCALKACLYNVFLKDQDLLKEAISKKSHQINKLNYFSKNDWLSFAVAWPTNFSCTLVRQPDVVYGREFAEIDAMYWQEKYSREQKRS